MVVTTLTTVSLHSQILAVWTSPLIAAVMPADRTIFEEVLVDGGVDGGVLLDLDVQLDVFVVVVDLRVEAEAVLVEGAYFRLIWSRSPVGGEWRKLILRRYIPSASLLDLLTRYHMMPDP